MSPGAVIGVAGGWAAWAGVISVNCCRAGLAPVPHHRHVQVVDVPVPGHDGRPPVVGLDPHRLVLHHRDVALGARDAEDVDDVDRLQQVGPGVGLQVGRDLGRRRQHVGDVHELQVGDAVLDVLGGRVVDPDDGLARLLGELGLVDEVVRRGERRLHQGALHGGLVGPVGDELEDARRAELVQRRVVLPHHPTERQALQVVVDLLVLRPGGLGFVARVVPLDPTAGHPRAHHAGDGDDEREHGGEDAQRHPGRQADQVLGHDDERPHQPSGPVRSPQPHREVEEGQQSAVPQTAVGQGVEEHGHQHDHPQEREHLEVALAERVGHAQHGRPRRPGADRGAGGP